MMNTLINTANDFTFSCVAGLYFAIGFTVLCVVVGIIEAIPTKEERAERAARKRRRSGKRYTVEIRPDRRY